MMHSHLLILVVFSSLVSAVFSTLQRDEPRERLRFGLLTFSAFLLTTFVLGWIMYPLPW